MVLFCGLMRKGEYLRYRGPLFGFTSISNGFVYSKINERRGDVDFDIVCLFDLSLYVHGKQLMSCDGQLLNHTVPGQVPEAVYQN